MLRRAREQDQFQFRADLAQISPDRFGDGLVQRRLDGGPVVHAGHLFLFTRRRRAAQLHAAEAFEPGALTSRLRRNVWS